MNKVYVVISVRKFRDERRTFLHGVFENEETAKQNMSDVEKDLAIVEEEGYAYFKDVTHRAYILEVAKGLRINELI